MRDGGTWAQAHRSTESVVQPTLSHRTLKAAIGSFAIAMLGAVPPALAAPVSSPLIGRVTITSGLSGIPLSSGSTAAPIAVMNLTFGGLPYNTVAGDLIPFTGFRTTTIVGIDIPGFTDTCGDLETVSGSIASAGQFNPVTGSVNFAQLELRVTHSLARTTTTSFLGLLFSACEATHLPDDVVTISLDTAAPTGSALDAAGNLTVAGTGVVASGARAGSPVSITVAGKLTTLPDRHVPSNCVVVPDVVGSNNLTNASRVVRDAGLVPILQWGLGQQPRNPYINSETPGPDECVPAGTKINLGVRGGFVP